MDSIRFNPNLRLKRKKKIAPQSRARDKDQLNYGVAKPARWVGPDSRQAGL